MGRARWLELARRPLPPGFARRNCGRRGMGRTSPQRLQPRRRRRRAPCAPRLLLPEPAAEDSVVVGVEHGVQDGVDTGLGGGVGGTIQPGGAAELGLGAQLAQQLACPAARLTPAARGRGSVALLSSQDRGSEPVRRSGVEWVSGSSKRQCDRTLLVRAPSAHALLSEDAARGAWCR
jgi:hypothetical protein